jgi:hypothetical protein
MVKKKDTIILIEREERERGNESKIAIFENGKREKD